eukprot:7900725-Pyramimonas_sp.AAC.1
MNRLCRVRADLGVVRNCKRRGVLPGAGRTRHGVGALEQREHRLRGGGAPPPTKEPEAPLLHAGEHQQRLRARRLRHRRGAPLHRLQQRVPQVAAQRALVEGHARLRGGALRRRVPASGPQPHDSQRSTARYSTVQ